MVGSNFVELGNQVTKLSFWTQSFLLAVKWKASFYYVEKLALF